MLGLSKPAIYLTLIKVFFLEDIADLGNGLKHLTVVNKLFAVRKAIISIVSKKMFADSRKKNRSALAADSPKSSNDICDSYQN